MGLHLPEDPNDPVRVFIREGIGGDGAPATKRNANRNSNRNASYRTITIDEEDPEDRYKWESAVIYAGISLLAAAGISLALSVDGPWYMKLGQVLGFLASTISIIIVKRNLSRNKYIGRQRDYAVGFYVTGVVFESLTLFAKYNEWFIDEYLSIVAFTLPALLLGMYKLINMDPEARLERIKRENELKKTLLTEEEELLKVSNRINKRLAILRAEENVQGARNTRMMKQSKGLITWIKAFGFARAEMNVIYQNLEVTTSQPKRKRVQAKDAKVIGEKKKRKTMGPRPENAINGINCKNPKCDNKLPEGRRTYCTDQCSNRHRAQRARDRKKLQEA